MYQIKIKCIQDGTVTPNKYLHFNFRASPPKDENHQEQFVKRSDAEVTRTANSDSFIGHQVQIEENNNQSDQSEQFNNNQSNQSDQFKNNQSDQSDRFNIIEHPLTTSEMVVKSSLDSEILTNSHCLRRGDGAPRPLSRGEEVSPQDNSTLRFGLRASAFIEGYLPPERYFSDPKISETLAEGSDDDLPPSLPLSAVPPTPFSSIVPPFEFTAAPALPPTSAPELPSSPVPNLQQFHDDEQFEDEDDYASSYRARVAPPSLYSAELKPVNTAQPSPIIVQSMKVPSQSLQNEQISSPLNINETIAGNALPLHHNVDTSANSFQEEKQDSKSALFVESKEHHFAAAAAAADDGDDLTKDRRTTLVKQSSTEFSSYVSLIQGSGYRPPKLAQSATTGLRSISFQKYSTSLDSEDGENAVTDALYRSPDMHALTKPVSVEGNKSAVSSNQNHNQILTESKPYSASNLPDVGGTMSKVNDSVVSVDTKDSSFSPQQSRSDPFISHQLSSDTSSLTSPVSTLSDLSNDKSSNVVAGLTETTTEPVQSVPQMNDSLSKFRRSMTQDEMISNVMKDYYTAVDKPIPAEEIEKKKPVKPLIAQALLPKSTRRPSAPVVSSYLPAVTSASMLPSSPPPANIPSNSSSEPKPDTLPLVCVSEKPNLFEDGNAEFTSKANVNNLNLSTNGINGAGATAFYSDILFPPDTKGFDSRSGNTNESKSYIMSKFLDDDANHSSKDSVCSGSYHLEAECPKDVEYGVNVAGSKAFFESLKGKVQTSKLPADMSLVTESDSGSVKSADMDSVSMVMSQVAEPRSSGIISPPSEVKSSGITLSKAVSMSLSETRFSPKAHSDVSSTWRKIDSPGSQILSQDLQTIEHLKVKSPSQLDIIEVLAPPDEFTDNTLAHVSESKAFFEKIKQADSSKQPISKSNARSDVTSSVGFSPKTDLVSKSKSSAVVLESGLADKLKTSDKLPLNATLSVVSPDAQTAIEILEEELAKVNQSKAFFESLKPRENKPMAIFARAASVQHNGAEYKMATDNGQGIDSGIVAGKEEAISKPIFRRGSLQAAKHPGMIRSEIKPSPDPRRAIDLAIVGDKNEEVVNQPVFRRGSLQAGHHAGMVIKKTPPATLNKMSSPFTATLSAGSGSSVSSRTPSLTTPDILYGQEKKLSVENNNEEQPSVERLVSKFALFKTAPDTEKELKANESSTTAKKSGWFLLKI